MDSTHPKVLAAKPVRPSPSGTHSGPVMKKPKLDKAHRHHRDGHVGKKDKHGRTDKHSKHGKPVKPARPPEGGKPTVKKEHVTPPKRKPMISESESEDDIPLALRRNQIHDSRPQPPSMPSLPEKVNAEVKGRKPAISDSDDERDPTLALHRTKLQDHRPHQHSASSLPSKVRKDGRGTSGSEDDVPLALRQAQMQGRHAPMAAPSTVPKVKRESEASASDDDIPLAQRRLSLSSGSGTPDSLPKPRSDGHHSASKTLNSKLSRTAVGSSTPRNGAIKREQPPAKAGVKRKKVQDSDDEDSDKDFKPKMAKTSPAVAKRRSTGASGGSATKKRGKDSVKREPVTPTKKGKASPAVSPAKGGRKKEEPKVVRKWWEEEPLPEGVKWLSLEHKGPFFAPLYEPLPDDVQFLYGGQPMKLSPKAEEAAGFFAKMLDHEYTTKDVFCNNFFQDWRREMTAEEAATIKDFSKCDFTQIHRYYVERAEARKAMSKEEKAVIKAENEKILEEYGWAIVDGHRERIGNFKVEPPGLFRGRGDHPKQGRIKRRIEAEDVIINIGKGVPVPEPPPGHSWKAVQHDNKVTWLASWNENIQGQTKYVMLSPTSKIKGEKDHAKYETARKLKDCVDRIRESYRVDWKSKEMKVRQRATAVYFIDKLALRAGNEKDSDESADTVGCCSLRVEHLKLHDELDGKEFMVEFDFLGKDSIRYYNRVPVEKQVFKNLRHFVRDKVAGDDLFDRLNTTMLNKHLSELMPGLTAKVFRTYNASKTLQEQLDDLTEEPDPIPSKILSYNRANRAVAVLCNHQRAPPKTFDQQMTNLQAKVQAKEEAIVEARSELKALKKEARTTKDTKVVKKVESKKKALERLEEQLHKLEVQATDKQENKEIALGTSKLNYLDPRISVAWCKKWDVPVEKIYNKTQRDKFAWAIDMADEDFTF